MRRAPYFISVVAAAALIADVPVSLAAQDAEDELIVTGQKALAEKRIRTLSRSISTTMDGHLARFQEPVCAASIGLPERLNDMVAARIAKDARLVGAPVGKAKCRPNLTVIFTDDGKAFVRELLASDDAPYVGNLTSHQREALLEETGPVFSIVTSELRGRDGDRLFRSKLSPASDEQYFLQIRSSSIIQKATRRDIHGVILIIENDAALGKTVRQLADYSAMRGLAVAKDSDASSGEPTILSLFGQGASALPGELTAFDTSYLKVLYAGSAPADGTVQHNAVAHMMVDKGSGKGKAGPDQPAN